MQQRTKIRARFSSERVLLINPAIYDIRLHWPKWQIPATLLQIGADKRADGADVRLVDLVWCGTKRIPRQQQPCILVDGSAIQSWRFGSDVKSFVERLKALATDFEPDLVVVECFTTFWWQGAAEAIRCARAVWPNCEIAVVGGYAEFAQEHAGKHSGADFIQPKPPLAETPTTNLTFYPAGGPKTAQLRVGGHELEAVLDAVTACRKSGAEEFSLEIRNLGKEKAALARLREECARRKITIPFDILGCVQAEDFIRNSDCISDLRALGMRHVVFADDRSGSLCSSEAFVGSCIEAAELFYAAGYKRRTDTVTASLCIGRPGEDLRDRIEAVTLLNHHIGSTILWPYQPLPSELPDQSLELQNGKLFPMREQNGLAYKDYAELVALNAVLNSRYRDCSFDFLGESLTARLLSESVSREAWNADESVKGSTVLPMRAGQ